MEKYYFTEFVDSNEQLYYHWFNGQSVEHEHDFFEFLLVTEGEMEHKYMNKTRTLSSRSVVLVKPDIPHDPSSSKNTRHFTISISADYCKKICSFISRDLYDLLIFENSDFFYMLNAEEYRYLLMKINSSLEISEIDNSMTINQTDIFDVTIILLSNIYKNHLSNKSKKKEFPPWFNTFLEQISSPAVFTGKISEIYKKSFYSQTATINYFKKYMDMTLEQYIISLRMRYAKYILLKTNYTVITVANECGYSSLSRFNTLFKKYYKTTPSEFRKKCQTTKRNNLTI